jgi:hypothetical protein
MAVFFDGLRKSKLPLQRPATITSGLRHASCEGDTQKAKEEILAHPFGGYSIQCHSQQPLRCNNLKILLLKQTVESNYFRNLNV